MIPINNNKEPTKSFTDAIFTKKIYYKFDYNPPFPHSYIKPQGSWISQIW